MFAKSVNSQPNKFFFFWNSCATAVVSDARLCRLSVAGCDTSDSSTPSSSGPDSSRVDSFQPPGVPGVITTGAIGTDSIVLNWTALANKTAATLLSAP